jgi:hypothetical protein
VMKNCFPAVEDFQLQFIQTVTVAIHSLLPKFSKHFETSPSCHMVRRSIHGIYSLISGQSSNIGYHTPIQVV